MIDREILLNSLARNISEAKSIEVSEKRGVREIIGADGLIEKLEPKDGITIVLHFNGGVEENEKLKANSDMDAEPNAIRLNELKKDA